VLATTTSGGHATDNTKYWVIVTAIDAQGESLGSAPASITTGNSGTNVNTLTITIFTVPNATGYNVYVGSGATQPANSAMWLQTSVSGNANAPQPAVGATVTLADGVTTLPSGEVNPAYLTVSLTAAIATSGTAYSTIVTAGNTAKTFVDGSGNLLMWDGIIAQAVNNAAGAGTLGSQVAAPAATNGVLALSDIDNLLAAMYLQAAGDPDYVVMNPLDNIKLTNLVVGAGQLRYVVQSTADDNGDLTAQYRVTRYLNKSTGKELPIILDRYCPQGTLVFLPMSIPFPVPEVSVAVEIETNQEYWGVDFAIVDSNFKFADYVDETVKVYFLGGLGVLRGIYPSF
jgi:hypothetical protein